MLNLEDNQTSHEIYKQIWLALELNEEVSIFIEDPYVLTRKQNERNAAIDEKEKAQIAKNQKLVGKNKVGVDPDGLDDDEDIDSDEEERRE